MDYVKALVESHRKNRQAQASTPQLVEAYSMDNVFLADSDRVNNYLSSVISSLVSLKSEGKKVDVPLKYARSILARFPSQDVSARRSSLEGLQHLLKKTLKA